MGSYTEFGYELNGVEYATADEAELETYFYAPFPFHPIPFRKNATQACSMVPGL